MIPPFTCVCMLLAAGSGLYLYQTKHRAQLLDREIQRVLDQTETVRKRSGMLRAEYSLLSEPDRLTELARQYLPLKPLAPTQFVTIADLASRLPVPLPPGSFSPPPDEAAELPVASLPAKPAPVVVAVQAVAPKPVVPVAPVKPVQVASQPAPLTVQPAPIAAISTPAPAAAARAVAKPAVRPVESPTPAVSPVMAVAAAPIGASRVATVNGAARPAGNLIGESVARVARGLPPLPYRESVGTVTQVAAAPISATPFPAPAASTGSMLGTSVLGGTRPALPAPVPYGATR